MPLCMVTLCFLAKPLRGLMSPYISGGICMMRPVDTDAQECGGMVTLSAEAMSYPAEPGVASDGIDALLDVAVTHTA